MREAIEEPQQLGRSGYNSDRTQPPKHFDNLLTGFACRRHRKIQSLALRKRSKDVHWTWSPQVSKAGKPARRGHDPFLRYPDLLASKVVDKASQVAACP